MKERWNRLTRVQRASVAVLALLVLVFGAVYAVQAGRACIELNGLLLRLEQAGEGQAYTGKYRGEPWTVRVEPDKTIWSRWRGVDYGPYTVREDNTALPEEAWEGMRGVEVREGDTLLFRGGWDSRSGTCLWEDGRMENRFRVTYSVGQDGGGMQEYDQDGRALEAEDKVRLGAGAVLRLREGAETVHRGDWKAYAMGTVLALGIALYLLYAEELFRWDLHWRVRDPYGAEPSEWELFWRSASGVITAAVVLCIYGVGLTMTS